MVILLTSDNEHLAKARLAQLLKQLRGQTTQREFAKFLGTSYTAVQDWEKQVRFPKDANLQRIAQLKGWTQEELIHYLFAANLSSDPMLADASVNPLDSIMVQVQSLTLAQMQELIDYLHTQLSQMTSMREQGTQPYLNPRQKHNLHLLLKASLKSQSPTKAMARAELDADLFTDIFLRDDTNRVVDYEALKKFARLCYRVIQWRGDQLPDISHHRTYSDHPDQLFDDLNYWVEDGISEDGTAITE